MQKAHLYISADQTGKKKMGKQAKTISEAESFAGMWLHRGNVAAEKGKHELAERHYAKSQRWLDRLNTLIGND